MLPPWLPIAFADLGIESRPGPATEPRVKSYYAHAGHPEIDGDETAWCAAFVGACLARAHMPNSRSLLARSYLKFGTPLAQSRPGAIAVFSRAGDPTLGHVGFVVGETSHGLLILGGNQAHAVSIIEMPHAQLLGLRWPQETAGAADEDATKTDTGFERALSHVLTQEGGFSDDPHDPGGPTNLGITLGDLARYRGVPPTDDLATAVRALTRLDVMPIYRAFYWLPSRANELPPALALFHFDSAVNHGVAGAACLLQQALGVSVDGEIGPQTLGASSQRPVSQILDAYADIRRAKYRSLPTFWRFGRGWLARVDATLNAARSLILSSKPKENQPMTQVQDTAPVASDEPKWWGHSLTVWGTIVTTLATVLPVVGPFIGFDISAEAVRQLGDGVVRVAQALGGVVGIALTIYGRTRATQPLMRRDVMIKL